LWHSKVAVNVFLQRHGNAILKRYALQLWMGHCSMQQLWAWE